MSEKSLGQQCADMVYKECVMPHGSVHADIEGNTQFSQLHNVRLREDKNVRNGDSVAFTLRRKFITWIDSELLTPIEALDLLDERLEMILLVLKKRRKTDCHLVTHPVEMKEGSFSETPRHAPFPKTSPHEQHDISSGNDPLYVTETEVPFVNIEAFIKQIRQSIQVLRSSKNFYEIGGRTEIDVGDLVRDNSTQDTVAIKTIL